MAWCLGERLPPSLSSDGTHVLGTAKTFFPTLLSAQGMRMRLAGMLSAAEVEVLSRTEDRLRRRGIVRGALLGPDVVAQSMEDMSMADFGPNHPDNIVLGPLRMQDDDVSMGRSRSCSRCLWLCLFILVLVLAVTGLAALLGALTRPYIL